MKKMVEYAIKGMHCQACEKIISLELSKIDGVIVANISAQKSKGIVEIDTDKTSEVEVIRAIEVAGYEALEVNN